MDYFKENFHFPRVPGEKWSNIFWGDGDPIAIPMETYSDFPGGF